MSDTTLNTHTHTHTHVTNVTHTPAAMHMHARVGHRGQSAIHRAGRRLGSGRSPDRQRQEGRRQPHSYAVSYPLFNSVSCSLALNLPSPSPSTTPLPSTYPRARAVLKRSQSADAQLQNRHGAMPLTPCLYKHKYSLRHSHSYEPSPL